MTTRARDNQTKHHAKVGYRRLYSTFASGFLLDFLKSGSTALIGTHICYTNEKHYTFDLIPISRRNFSFFSPSPRYINYLVFTYIYIHLFSFITFTFIYIYWMHCCNPPSLSNCSCDIHQYLFILTTTSFSMMMMIYLTLRSLC